jgi:hypothetical protein
LLDMFTAPNSILCISLAGIKYLPCAARGNYSQSQG